MVSHPCPQRCIHGGGGLELKLCTLTIPVFDLLRSPSVICTVASGGSTIILFAEIVVTEAGMSVNLAVKASFISTIVSLVIDTLKHCLGCWLVKGPSVIETLA